MRSQLKSVLVLGTLLALAISVGTHTAQAETIPANNSGTMYILPIGHTDPNCTMKSGVNGLAPCIPSDGFYWNQNCADPLAIDGLPELQLSDNLPLRANHWGLIASCPLDTI